MELARRILRQRIVLLYILSCFNSVPSTSKLMSDFFPTIQPFQNVIQSAPTTTLLPTAITPSSESLYYKKLDLCLAPNSIGEGWTDTSAAACAITCKQIYESNCSSFIYDKITHLCTPAGQLSNVAPGPQQSPEGDLYVLDFGEIDLLGEFSVYRSGQITTLYFYNSTNANYTQAVETCTSLGSRLVTTATFNKFQFFADLVNSKGCNTWVGLSDRLAEEQLIWSDGQLFNWSAQASLFIRQQPDNVSNIHDCCYMSWTDKLLDQELCGVSMCFICEKICP
ncbi:uncharacterized protein LOC129928447 [Biomphalaria glabrata]|uniref:Uncharacterized protein LOC129928447 n=1 Tax=Biomphalaria glabrata TaxID=6526 RepID=A0A9W3BHH8_BIOGL|nr:uncharacterized protein LOC129928447 [Biomphalaria glabrata]